jgi:hypothetical protein
MENNIKELQLKQNELELKRAECVNTQNKLNKQHDLFENLALIFGGVFLVGLLFVTSFLPISIALMSTGFVAGVTLGSISGAKGKKAKGLTKFIHSYNDQLVDLHTQICDLKQKMVNIDAHKKSTQAKAQKTTDFTSQNQTEATAENELKLTK